MSTHRLRVEAAGRGDVKITLDDHEITNAVMSINITGDGRQGWATKLALMPSPLDVDIVTTIGVDLTEHDAQVRCRALYDASLALAGIDAIDARVDAVLRADVREWLRHRAAMVGAEVVG